MSQIPALTDDELQAARENWRLMDDDLREFTVALVDAGMVDGRRGLAYARVVRAPERLPSGDGVCPCIQTRQEREAIQAIKARGKRA